MEIQTILFIVLVFPRPVVVQIELPQSYIILSDIGYYFEPAQDVEWLNDMLVDRLTECIQKCNEDFLCRTFDYNLDPNRCRLFQVEASPEQIVYSSSSASQVGQVQLFANQYLAFNQTCDYCARERYLTCIGGTCQCPYNTFWDGSICQKLKYAGEFCTDWKECQIYIYNLTCASAAVCTPAGYSTHLCALNRNSVLLNYATGIAKPYSVHSFNITAITTSITITFSLADMYAFWLLDNISLIEVNTTNQLINNGDFETGNLTNWNYCNPNATGNASRLARNGSFPSQSGQYFYLGGPRPYSDFLSQTISTVIGKLYTLSFWVGHTGNSSNNRFIVTLFF